MIVPQVLVETNWVVDFVAPHLSRNPSARELHQRAQRGELRLHVPAIALIEARKVIREKQPRGEANAIRAYLREIRETFGSENADIVLGLLNRYEAHLKSEKENAPTLLRGLLHDPALRIVAQDQEMMEREIELAATTPLELKPFDSSILCAVLVEGRRLSEHAPVSFCTLDPHLWPWAKHGETKPELRALYDQARIWVYPDFLLITPPRPADWPA